eukprot:133565-Pleurochrysis_carterae.AAC.2
MQDYLGSELGFYFAWSDFYTWCLWVPSIAGAVISAVDYFLLHPDKHCEGRNVPGSTNGLIANLTDQSSGELDLAALARNLSGVLEDDDGDGMAASDDQECRREYTLARNVLLLFFALLLMIWGTLFLEGWKRRVKSLSLDWGLLNASGQAVRPAMLSGAATHQKFKEDDIKPGFYTDDNVWVKCVLSTARCSAQRVVNPAHHRLDFCPYNAGTALYLLKSRVHEPCASTRARTRARMCPRMAEAS